MVSSSVIPKQNMTLERLHSLYELIGRMNSVYELQDLLEFVVDRALSLTGGRRGLLLLDDDSEHKLLQHVAVARGEELGEEELERALEFVSTTVIKDVLDRGEPRIVMDLSVDHRYEGLTSEQTTQFKRVRSVLAVPLKIDDERVGLVYIDHPQRNVFSQSDLDFLSAFAAQAAQAIHRTRQYQRQIEELTLLNQLSRSVVKVLDLDQVLARIIDEAIQMLNVETGSVLLLGEDGKTLSFSISVSGGKRVEIPTALQIGEGLAGWVVKTGEVACVSDVSGDERWFGEVEIGFNTRSILCIPLKLDGRVLGVLQVLNKKSPHGFDSTDVTLLSAFAASATIAIENARMFQEASRARQLHALNEVALKLSSTLDLETILHTGLEQSLKILRIDAGAISLVDGPVNENEPVVRISRDAETHAPLGEIHRSALVHLSRLAISSHQDDSILIDRDHLLKMYQCQSLVEADMLMVILTPIKVGREVMGVLVLLERTQHAFSSETISLLTGMARIIGLAVQNATHYSLMRSKTMQLTYLNEVGAVLTSSLDLSYILKVIIEGVNTLLETERTSVFLIDDETNELVLRYSNLFDAEIHLPAPWQGIAGWVATHDRAAVVNDTYSDPRQALSLRAAAWPATAISSSSGASRTRSTLPKCRSSLTAVLSPIPGI
jgi:GAF domain-containing protein